MAHPRLESLTGLRFFAAYGVLVHHFTVWAPIPQLQSYADFGPSGVSFFFVLSGFVLAWSAPVGDTPGRFYWRRFARIWPLHLVATLAAIPVFYSLRGLPVDWGSSLLSVALLHAWVPSAAVYFAGNPASWSLSCEAFFYAAFPWLWRRTGRLNARAAYWCAAVLLGLMAAVALVTRHELAAADSFWALYISPLYRLGEFTVGVLVAGGMRLGWRPNLRFWPTVLGVLLYVGAIYDVAPNLPHSVQNVVTSLTYAATPAMFAVVIAATARRDLLGRPTFLASKAMIKLGQWSYALYLTHATLIYIALALTGRLAAQRMNLWLLVPFSAISVAVAALLYERLEHPVERRLRRILQPPVLSDELRVPTRAVAP